MSKYLFNGIPLPALPEYDATTRPYSYIARGKDGKYYFIPRTSKTNVTPEGAAWLLSGLNIIYVSDGNAWISSDTYDSVHYIVWANYDVMYVEDTSTLYLAASDPVPVLEIQIPEGVDRYSYVVGFNLALAGMAYPYSAPTPVAYLYNGIRLPALPEWDRGVYPYAVITDRPITHSTMVLLVFHNTAYYFTSNTGSRYFGGDDDSLAVPCYRYSYDAEKNMWSEPEYLNNYNTLVGKTAALSGPMWSNFDVLNEDGTVYLAASDPVPVYE